MPLPELLLRPDLGKRAYRLRCRFTVGAGISPDKLETAKMKTAELFVQDMRKQGWEYDPNRLEARLRGFTLKGPFSTTPITGAPSRLERVRFDAKRDLSRVLAGDNMRLPDIDYAITVPLLDESDTWEYEISAIFIRNTILTEVPDSHEEFTQ